MNKIKRVYDWICSAEIITIILLIIVNVFPCFFGYKPYVVISGSMEPEIMTGDMAYVKMGVKSDDIKIGDIIAFCINNESFVTHRVIDINKTEKNFITKGDANETRDFEPVSYDQIIGKTKFSIPYLGYIMAWLKSKKGYIILIGLTVSQLLINYLFNDREEK